MNTTEFDIEQTFEDVKADLLVHLKEKWKDKIDDLHIHVTDSSSRKGYFSLIKDSKYIGTVDFTFKGGMFSINKKKIDWKSQLLIERRIDETKREQAVTFNIRKVFDEVRSNIIKSLTNEFKIPLDDLRLEVDTDLARSGSFGWYLKNNRLASVPFSFVGGNFNFSFKKYVNPLWKYAFEIDKDKIIGLVRKIYKAHIEHLKIESPYVIRIYKNKSSSTPVRSFYCFYQNNRWNITPKKGKLRFED